MGSMEMGMFSNYIGVLVAMATKIQAYLGGNHHNSTKKSTSAYFNHFHKL